VAADTDQCMHGVVSQSTVHNGCVWAIPGSHLAGRQPGSHFIRSWTSDRPAGEVPAAVPVEAERGDVLVILTY
jgi:ectoine hydroxylase-related dioxygenase (phytanoyl-CoA dioxygenase family)